MSEPEPNPPRCIIMGDYLFFGQTTFDENFSFVPLPNGWKIKLEEPPAVDGTRRLIFTYINADGTESDLYTFNPPSALSTSIF